VVIAVVILSSSLLLLLPSPSLRNPPFSFSLFIHSLRCGGWRPQSPINPTLNGPTARCNPRTRVHGAFYSSDSGIPVLHKVSLVRYEIELGRPRSLV
jgi:hypothetical protein